MTKADGYELIDSGDQKKLERFGDFILSRPCSQAVWKKSLPNTVWEEASATFTRIDDKRWHSKGELPESWNITTQDIVFKLSCTDFGHLGIFPEVRPYWSWLRKTIKEAKRPIRVLNLFAYSGGVTLAAALAGAEVCHLDASKGMVSWARENAALNGLENAPIRWIVEDVQKFVTREVKRGKTYDAIFLDPPTFGRGSQGELFKIETHIHPLLDSIQALLSPEPLFVLFSCHTPGFTPTVLSNLLGQRFSGAIESGEMLLESSKSLPIPSGAFARWVAR